MGLSAKLENSFVGFSKWTRAKLVTYTEYQNVKKKKALINRVQLSENNKEDIDGFFKQHYGKKIPYHWHKLYQSYTGVFRKDYFPEILFSTKLEPMLNPYREAEFLGDKNLLPLLFDGDQTIKVPKTYGSCVKGRFRDDKHCFVSMEELCMHLSDIGDCVIKKTVDTSSGRDVQICNFVGVKDAISGRTIEEILQAFGKNYIIQEKIVQHLSALIVRQSGIHVHDRYNSRSLCGKYSRNYR